MSSDNAVGIMDGAYFTSRSDILEFINNLLDLNLTKIEQTASGAVACQICEYMFPGSVPMRRVNWETKNSYEYVQNYKLLQAAFTKNRVQKYVDVDKLIRGKYQDNLEFCQWLKAFFDQQQGGRSGGGSRDDYDPVSVRAKGKGGKTAREHLTGTANTPKKSSSGSRAPLPRKNSTRTVSNKSRTAPPSSSSSSSQKREDNNNKNKPISSTNTKSQKENFPDTSINNSSSSNNNNNNDSIITKDTAVANTALLTEIEDLGSRNAELELLVNEIEKERDFYFNKLRSVEVLLQVFDEDKKKFPVNKVEQTVYDTLLGKVLKVLYATTDDDVVVDDDGNVAVENNNNISGGNIGDSDGGGGLETVLSGDKGVSLEEY